MELDDKEQARPSVVPPFQIPLAVVTKQRFAGLTGQELGVADARVDRRLLPSIKVGGHRMVNLARLWVDALNAHGGGDES